MVSRLSIFSLVGGLLFLGLLAGAWPQLAAAQNNTGIGIRPAIIEGPAEPGTTQTHEVTVTNLSSSQQVYYLFVRDIAGVTGAGAPLFADVNAEKSGFEMSEWVTLSSTEVDLAPGGESTFKADIAIPEDATPGSHFGAIFVSLDPPRMRELGAAVGYDVANIISLRVAGEVDERAAIRQFATDNYIYGNSIVDFQVRIENEGNVLIRPVGPLEIHNMFGRRVAMLTFNESKAGVFPGVSRDFEIVWEDEGPGFGRYEAVLSLVYGEQGRLATMSSSVSFWILPMNIIGPALGVLAFLLLVTFISVRLYVRSKLRAVGTGGRRLVRQRRATTGVPLGLLLMVAMLVVTALFLIVLLILFA